ncbi:hypothetical protein PAMP_015440 [Pampus punctatissimus]
MDSNGPVLLSKTTTEKREQCYWNQFQEKPLGFVDSCRVQLQQDSLCSPQLIMEDEGLSRLALTIQMLVDLADGS